MLPLVLIHETERMTKICYDATISDDINYDAFQAVCFLVVAHLSVELTGEEVEHCLDLLGVPCDELWKTIRHLERFYDLPHSADVRSFSKAIMPLLLMRSFLCN